jgi:AraC-like DNA-binding protein
MKPFVQILPQLENSSFVIQTINTRYFQTGLHQHTEYEFIFFTEGTGIVWIGDYEGKYKPGDIYLIGSNLPHAFKSSNNKPVSAVTIHFRNNCWGNHFMNIPECSSIKQLLEIAASGLQVAGHCKSNLEPLIKALTTATSINRVIMLLQCLENISTVKEYVILSKKKVQIYKDSDTIDKIIDFTLTSCHHRISLSQVAELACMSVSAFCHYFKRRTQKTYIDFLNEVRVGYACKQLLQTNKPVTDIGYESGYNTVAYFHRQFLRIKKITPLQYRNQENENTSCLTKSKKVTTVNNNSSIL